MSKPITMTNGQNEIKIYSVKNRDRNVFQLSYYEAGKRQRQTFSDLPDAKRESKIILGRLAIGALGVEKFSSSDLESFAVAQKLALPTGMPVHLCVESYAKAHEILDGALLMEVVKFYKDFHPTNYGTKTLAGLAEQFVAVRKAMNVHPDYIENLKRQLGRMAKAFPGKSLSQYRTEELDTWLSSQTWAPETKNNIRNYLIAFGNWAKKNRYLPSNCPTAFDGMLIYKKPSTKVTIYTPDNLTSLLKAAKTEHAVLLPWLACAAFTGARVSELNLLRWEDINFDRDFVVIASKKIRTKARRLVPLQPALKSWLLPLRQETGLINVYAAPQTCLKRLAKKAGVALQDNGFRHSYITYRLADINDTARVALEAGNSPDIIFQHYRELVGPEEGKAWFGVKDESEPQPSEAKLPSVTN